MIFIILNKPLIEDIFKCHFSRKFAKDFHTGLEAAWFESDFFTNVTVPVKMAHCTKSEMNHGAKIPHTVKMLGRNNAKYSALHS